MDIFPSKEAILEMSSLDFRIAFAYYNMNNSLEDSHRIKIAKAIITHILEDNPNQKLTRDDFEHLAGLIVEIFPTETAETFFTRSMKQQGVTGKLFSSYSNIRNALAEVGIIKRETRRKT